MVTPRGVRRPGREPLRVPANVLRPCRKVGTMICVASSRFSPASADMGSACVHNAWRLQHGQTCESAPDRRFVLYDVLYEDNTRTSNS
jgi:hypothetical protein